MQELHKLVALGEGIQLEFKRKAADPLKIMREVVAFANTRGGKLMIGVNDDLTIPGLKDPEEHDYAISTAIETYCNPAVKYEVTYVELSAKKTVVVFNISESERKPVFLLYNLKKKIGRAYVRVADRSVNSSREVRQVLKARARKITGHFSYGPKEGILFRMLDAVPTITLADFAKQAEISRQEAADILVSLVIAGVVDLQPEEAEDLYSLRKHAFR